MQTMQDILKETCKAYGVTAENMQSKSRTKMLVQARRTFAQKVYNECGASMYEIGKELGDRDSTTVFYYLHGKKKDLHTEVNPELDPKM